MSDSVSKTLWWLTGTVLAISGVSAGIALWRESQVPSPVLLDIFDFQFVSQEPVAALMAAIIGLVAFYFARRVAIDEQQGALEVLWSRRWLVAGAVFLVCTIGSLNVYRMAAISGDEYANVIQTKVFSRGTFFGVWPPALATRMAPIELANRILVADDGSGRIITSYQPAFAFFAAPFERAGLRFLVNPLIAAGIVLLAGLSAWRLWRQAWLAGLSMLLMASCVSVVGFGMGSFATNFILLLHLLFLFFFIRGTPWSMVAAGVVGGIALHTGNQIPQLLVALPAFFLLIRARRYRDVACLALPYLPFVAAFSFGWTGLVQGVSHVHRQEAASGLGSAATELAWLGEHLKWPTFRQFLQDGMSLLRFALWAVPGLIGLAGLGLLSSVSKNRHHQDRSEVVALAENEGRIIQLSALQLSALQLSAFALAGAVGFYFMFPLNQGHGWGYRYLHPALGFMLILGLSRVVREGPSSRVVTWLMVSASLSLALLLPLRISQISGFVAERLALLPCLPEEQTQICFVDSSKIYWGPDLIQNEPFLDLSLPLRGRLILKSLGEESDARLIQDIFPGAKKSPGVTSPGSGSVWIP